MGLHDRDYVREKDFNYRKMEYSKNVKFEEKGDVKMDDFKINKSIRIFNNDFVSPTMTSYFFWVMGLIALSIFAKHFLYN